MLVYGIKQLFISVLVLVASIIVFPFTFYVCYTSWLPNAIKYPEIYHHPITYWRCWLINIKEVYLDAKGFKESF